MPVIESTDSEEEMTECYRQTAKDSNNIKTKISKILQGSKSNQPEPPINNQQDEWINEWIGVRQIASKKQLCVYIQN